MKLFGLNLGKEKPVSFDQFRDMVRLAARRNHPGATITGSDSNGFNLTIDGKPQYCNVRTLYINYTRNPSQRELLIDNFLKTLVVEIPTHSWNDVIPLLRPSLRSTAFLRDVHRSLSKQAEPDSLPSQPFVGDLHVIAVVDLPGQAAAVTQGILDGWGVSLEEALKNGLNNLSMSPFPNIANSLMAGGGGGKKSISIQEEVGIVFEDNYLTATWIISERFRDYVGQRLQGSYVVSVPNRGKMTCVRADEPGLIANIQTANRNYATQPYPLTAQLFHVSASTTGGVITLYDPSGKGDVLGADSIFAAGKASALPNISHAAAGIPQRDPLAATGRDLNGWHGLSESKDDAPPPPSGKKTGGQSKR
jgi:hypothetical protein